MKVEVTIETSAAEGTFEISMPTIPEVFEMIPHIAANHGLALLNDGEPVSYSIRVVAP